MSTSKNIKLDKFIESQIKQFLFEDDIDPLADMLKYIQDEEKRTKVEINNDNRIKGAQINPDERKIKDTSIKRNKERLEKMRKIEDDLKQQQVIKKQQDQANLAQTTATATQTTANSTVDITGGVIGGVGMTENMAMPMIRRSFAEQAPVPAPAPAPTKAPAPAKKKTVRVMFDKSTGKPFYVDFSERGFSINGTRLSFELIESALSKEFNIVLEHGNGQMLDQVKMQKILKYKDRY